MRWLLGECDVIEPLYPVNGMGFVHGPYICLISVLWVASTIQVASPKVHVFA